MPESGEGKCRQALEEQISAMAGRIRYFLKKSFGLQSADVEDVTQETLLAAVAAVRSEGFQLEPNARLTTFVHAIAKHKALDFLKSRRVRRHRSLDDERGKIQIAIDLGPELVKADLLQRIATLIERLPEKQAFVLYLIYDQGYSVAAAASEMNITATQVSTLKFAALGKLRQWSSEEGLLLVVIAAFLWWTLWRMIHGL